MRLIIPLPGRGTYPLSDGLDLHPGTQRSTTVAPVAWNAADESRLGSVRCRVPCWPRDAGSRANRRASSVPRAEQVSPGAAGSTAEQQSQTPAFAADGKNCAD